MGNRRHLGKVWGKCRSVAVDLQAALISSGDQLECQTQSMQAGCRSIKLTFMSIRVEQISRLWWRRGKLANLLTRQ